MTDNGTTTFGRINNSAPWTFNGGTLNFLANPGTGVAPISSSQILGAVLLASGQATIQSGWLAAPAVGTTSTLDHCQPDPHRRRHGHLQRKYVDLSGFQRTTIAAAGATEATNTVTITTATAHGFVVGQTVTIAGVTVAGYNGTFTILTVPSATTFTYTDATAGLAASGGGIASAAVLNLAATESANTVTITTPSTATTATGVSETGTTVTVTTAVNHNFVVGQTVVISGVTPNGYNGTYVITAVTATTFTYTNPVSGLAASTVAGTVQPAHGFVTGQKVTLSGFTAPSTGYNGTYTITSIPNAATFTYTAATSGLAAATGGTATMVAPNQIVLQSQPTLTGTTGNQILPYALVASTGTPLADFATIAGSAPFNLLRFNNYTTGGINAAATGSVYKETANETLTANVSLNGLLISGTNLTLSGAATGAGATLTLTGGALGLTATTASTDNISVPTLAFGTAEGIITLDGSTANSVNLNSSITGSGGLTITGAGLGVQTLVLPFANAYTGTTTLNSGVLSLGQANALASGAGAVALNGGTLQSTVALTLNNPYTLATSNVTIGGSNNLTLSGPGTLTNLAAPANLSASAVANVFGSTLTITNTALTTLSGAIGGAGSLIFAGAAGNTLASGAGTYSGGTFLTAGNLILGASSSGSVTNGPVGTGTLILAGGTLLSDSSARTLANNVTFAGATTLAASSIGAATSSGSSLTFSGTVTLATIAAASTLTVNDTTTFSGALSGPLALTVAGIGTLTLPNANAGFSAGVNLNNGNSLGFMGTLVVGNAAALGVGFLTLTSGNLQTTVPGGVTLANQLAAGAVAGNFITFTGSNPFTFSNSLATYDIVPATAVYQTSAGASVTFNETLAGAGGVTLMGPSSSMIFNQASTFTGAVTASGGTVTINGASGALTATANVALNQGGTLKLDNTTAYNPTVVGLAANPNRINPTATITLNGGTFNYVGSSTALSSQTFTSPLTANTGNSTINVTNNGPNAILTFGSFARAAGNGTVNFSAGAGQTLDTATNQIIFTTAATLTNGIIKGATVTDSTTFSGNTTGFNLATNNGNNVVAMTLTTTNAYTVGLPASGSSATANYLVTSSTALTASESVNALLLVGDGININAPAIAGIGGITLTNTTGTIATTGMGPNGDAISVPALALGAVDGIFLTNGLTGSATNTISSSITGTGGLTIGGAGTLALPSANGVSGAVNINGGIVSLGSGPGPGRRRRDPDGRHDSGQRQRRHRGDQHVDAQQLEYHLRRQQRPAVQRHRRPERHQRHCERQQLGDDRSSTASSQPQSPNAVACSARPAEAAH